MDSPWWIPHEVTKKSPQMDPLLFAGLPSDHSERPPLGGAQSNGLCGSQARRSCGKVGLDLEKCVGRSWEKGFFHGYKMLPTKHICAVTALWRLCPQAMLSQRVILWSGQHIKSSCIPAADWTLLVSGLVFAIKMLKKSVWELSLRSFSWYVGRLLSPSFDCLKKLVPPDPVYDHFPVISDYNFCVYPMFNIFRQPHYCYISPFLLIESYQIHHIAHISLSIPIMIAFALSPHN